MMINIIFWRLRHLYYRILFPKTPPSICVTRPALCARIYPWNGNALTWRQVRVFVWANTHDIYRYLYVRARERERARVSQPVSGRNRRQREQIRIDFSFRLSFIDQDWKLRLLCARSSTLENTPAIRRPFVAIITLSYICICEWRPTFVSYTSSLHLPTPFESKNFYFYYYVGMFR